MHDPIITIPAVSKLVIIQVVLELYRDQFGEALPYPTLYTAAVRQQVPAYRLGTRIVFEKKDLPAVLARMCIRNRPRRKRREQA